LTVQNRYFDWLEWQGRQYPEDCRHEFERNRFIADERGSWLAGGEFPSSRIIKSGSAKPSPTPTRDMGTRRRGHLSLCHHPMPVVLKKCRKLQAQAEGQCFRYFCFRALP
jgi:hypothetical protein